MALTAGIVGLPNVGKSTLFNAITNSQVLAENYPFATIAPNVGVVEVPDERMDNLVELFHPKKVIYTTFEFTDIAGLVKGASKGEGLGNQFLANIRETNAIIHVVRCFDDANIEHVEGSIDPVRDIEEINLELCMADLDTVENRISKVLRKAQTKEKGAVEENNVLQKCREALLAGTPVRLLDLTDSEKELLKNYSLLTAKPVIYVANMSEDEVTDPEGTESLLPGSEGTGGKGTQRMHRDQCTHGRGTVGYGEGRKSGLPGRTRHPDSGSRPDHSGGVPSARASHIFHGRRAGEPGMDLPGGHESPAVRRHHPHGF